MLKDVELKLVKAIIDEDIFKQEFAHLKDTCYLDHTGSALYAKSQVEAIAQDLSANLYANPHSNSLPSRLTADTVDQVRYRILQHFNTNPTDYSVIFTSGATEALKLVAETFTFNKASTACDTIPNGDVSSSKGEFVYMQENHTSVLGMRNVDNVTKNKVSVKSISQSDAFKVFEGVLPNQGRPPVCKIHEDGLETEGNSLFVYSAQCNFSGFKYPLSWIKRVQDGVLDKHQYKSRWFCLLDAATFVATNPLDLLAVRPDFVTISFYKIFGVPTGLGALLVRNSSAYVLEKKYFGGGTVEMALASRSKHVFRPVLHERFEDGTINFLSILAVRHGFDSFDRMGFTLQQVSLYCFYLASYAHAKLRRLHHTNLRPACVLYADTVYDNPNTQGGIVNFNVRRDNGDFVGFMEVLNLANLHGIHLRTGCFCNPGACQRFLCISDEQYCKNFEAGHVCGDDHDLLDGRSTGSVRVSFGVSSSQRDVDRLIRMLEDCFVTKPVVYKEPENWKETLENTRAKFNLIERNKNDADTLKVCNGTNDVISNGFELKRDEDVPDEKYSTVSSNNACSLQSNISTDGDGLVLSQVCLYPVKSCGAMRVSRWPLDSKGLAYDRCWMIVNESGVALTQKQEPKLCMIRPVVDLDVGVLTLVFPGKEDCRVSLDPYLKPESEVSLCSSKVCGDSVRGVYCGEEAAAWLCKALCRPGLQLIRQSDSVLRTNSRRPVSNLSLNNQAQFLLVNTNSVLWLSDKLPKGSDCASTNMVDRFRSNFVIKGDCPAFEEQNWSQVEIGTTKFEVEGPCGRCQMICIDQSTGAKTKEPLTTLAANSHGKLKFGIYLRQTQIRENAYISVGDKVSVYIS